ncbi:MULTISPECIES: hypothetical protein [Arthrobacter]|uniref:Uncharacterized protein n=1 Tax=Arthrobacter terricola TaxID=2547396 RepID=A0A4R5K5D7_9MICC|nr:MULTISPECIES: hypothetical protein [Arthrobacter]MBT8163063.1 hypothetical protein [Arthrobacter sp. GN70]TDF88103.1 hypothetical protein E1809_24090 [Arthrobacter terricola]
MSSDFAATKAVKARKLHVCDECFRAISPGETYHRTAGSWEGDFFTNIACAHCHVFRKHINKADPDYFESYYGGAGEWVANGYWSALDLPGMTWTQRLGLYRMSQHFRDRWRDRVGHLRPIPNHPTSLEAVPTGAASVIQGGK